ncbi:helicase domain-containing protein [Ceratobasidium sp. AG-Ba]|nr:helicase domain-containing protein [Ceratobasidium sp. AG-Ba]QRW13684.1 Hydrocephalus-inducing protein [Ceratobasidium sp. AG-Ba]
MRFLSEKVLVAPPGVCLAGTVAKSRLVPGVKTAVAKRAHGERTLLLRPAVQLELSVDAQEGQMRQDALSMARRSQLLLILEQPLKERTLSDLAQALADEVHQQSGAVLYISRERLRTRGAYNYIDLQLDLNSQELVNLVNAAEEMQGQPQDPAGPDMFCDAADLWLEVFDDKGTILPQDLPGDDVIAMTDFDATPAAKDDFPMEEACVILDYYSPDGRRPRLSDAKKRFLCPECWQAKAGGLYPHFVRPLPRLHLELEGAPTPKLAVVIYYVEQFWPHATHLASMLTGRWTTKSWKCSVVSIKLEHLSEKRDLLSDLQVFLRPLRRSYQVMVVYFTHGLHGEQGFQISHRQSMRPAELLEHTLRPCVKLLEKAAQNVSHRASALNNPHHGLVLLAAMNTKLSPAYLVPLTVTYSTMLIRSGNQCAESMFRLWLADSLAPAHTDIFCWSRERVPELWVYAPFQSRPLGKPLPDILSTCTCPGLPDGPPRVLRNGSRKSWEVDHNGSDGCQLRDVIVKATCTVCRQMWPLHSEHMTGTLRKYKGVYAAVVPYFVASEELEGAAPP